MHSLSDGSQTRISLAACILAVNRSLMLDVTRQLVYTVGDSLPDTSS